MNEVQDDNAARWEKKLSRVLRRNAIQRRLAKRLPPSTIKKEVRAYENESHSKELIHMLLEREFVVDPNKERVAQNLYQHLVDSGLARPRFSIILMGSSVHGGSLLKQLDAEKKPRESDLDFGISFDGSDNEFMGALNERYIRKVAHASEIFLKNNSPYEMCWYINPRTYHIQNIRSVSHALAILQKIAKILTDDGFFDMSESLLLYFEPSIPPEINQRNKKLLLEGLRLLYNQNKQGWDKVTNDLLKTWESIHNLRIKHIDAGYNQRSDDLREEVAENSGQLMLRTMQNLINSTMTGAPIVREDAERVELLTQSRYDKLE